MAFWITLVIVGQFLTAIVALVDKYVVTSRTVSKPVTYAFYVGLLSGSSVLVFLFSSFNIPIDGLSIPSLANVHTPTPLLLGLSLGAGFSFIAAIYFLFTALRDADASDIIPVVGAVSAVTSLLLSSQVLGETLTGNFFWGFALLTIGTLAVSRFRLTGKTTLFAVAAGALFGLHFVVMKLSFLETSFDNAFLWTRLGIAGVALSMLVIPFLRKHILTRVAKKGRAKAGVIVVGNKILGGIASFLLLKAIELGSVSIVQALGGLQFVFLLLFSIFLGRDLPPHCGEKCRRTDLVQKTLSTSVIVIGFAILFA